jgi:hypothetical protein
MDSSQIRRDTHFYCSLIVVYGFIFGDQLADGGCLKETQSFRGDGYIHLNSLSDTYHFKNGLALVLMSREPCLTV